MIWGCYNLGNPKYILNVISENNSKLLKKINLKIFGEKTQRGKNKKKFYVSGAISILWKILMHSEPYLS